MNFPSLYRRLTPSTLLFPLQRQHSILSVISLLLVMVHKSSTWYELSITTPGTVTPTTNYCNTPLQTLSDSSHSHPTFPHTFSLVSSWQVWHLPFFQPHPALLHSFSESCKDSTRQDRHLSSLVHLQPILKQSMSLSASAQEKHCFSPPLPESQLQPPATHFFF